MEDITGEGFLQVLEMSNKLVQLLYVRDQGGSQVVIVKKEFSTMDSSSAPSQESFRDLRTQWCIIAWIC